MIDLSSKLDFSDPSKGLYKRILDAQAETVANRKAAQEAELASQQTKAKETLLPSQTDVQQKKLDVLKQLIPQQGQLQLGQTAAQKQLLQPLTQLELGQIGAKKQLLPQQTQVLQQLLGFKVPTTQAELAKTQATTGLAQAQAKGVQAKTALAPLAVEANLLKARGVDPIAHGEALQLVKDSAVTNGNATQAKDTMLPLYKNILTSLAKTPSTVGLKGSGIVSGLVLWSSAEGQELQAYLKQNQGFFIRQFHLGRMTQYEFKLLKGAVGGANTKTKALKDIIQKQIDSSNRQIKKQSFYHNYMSKGGKSATEAANQWIKTLGDNEVKTESESGEGQEEQTIKGSDGNTYTRRQLATLLGTPQ